MAIVNSVNSYNLLPIIDHIDFVDCVKQNPNDHRKVIFKIKGNPKTVIQWCRRNFGDRGDGWDFSGGENVEVIIWSSRLVTMWEMWQQ